MAWDKLKEKRPIQTKSIDGYIRTPQDESNLNKSFASVFKGDDGKLILDYIKSITTEAVASFRRNEISCRYNTNKDKKRRTRW